MTHRIAALWLALAACTPQEIGSEAAQAREAPSFKPDMERDGEPSMRNAYWLARLSHLAYLDEPELDTALSDLGFLDGENSYLRVFPGETYAFYLRTEGYAVLAFRGTKPDVPADLFADLNLNMIFNRVWVGRAADGFTEGPYYMWQWGANRGLGAHLRVHHSIDAETGERKGVPLYITGHSLGGSRATVALSYALYEECLLRRETSGSWLFDDSLSLPPCEDGYVPVRAFYSFGSQRVGNPDFAEDVVRRADALGTAVFRFVNRDDIIEKIPPVSAGYQHLSRGGVEDSTLVHLAEDGHIWRGIRAPTDGSNSAAEHGIAAYEEHLLHAVMSD